MPCATAISDTASAGSTAQLTTTMLSCRGLVGRDAHAVRATSIMLANNAEVSIAPAKAA